MWPQPIPSLSLKRQRTYDYWKNTNHLCASAHQLFLWSLLSRDKDSLIDWSKAPWTSLGSVLSCVLRFQKESCWVKVSETLPSLTSELILTSGLRYLFTMLYFQHILSNCLIVLLNRIPLTLSFLLVISYPVAPPLLSYDPQLSLLY